MKSPTDDGIWIWQLNLGLIPDLVQEIPKVLTAVPVSTSKAAPQQEGAQCRKADKAGCHKLETFLSGHKMASLFRSTRCVGHSFNPQSRVAGTEMYFKDYHRNHDPEVTVCCPDSSPRLPSTTTCRVSSGRK